MGYQHINSIQTPLSYTSTPEERVGKSDNKLDTEHESSTHDTSEDENSVIIQDESTGPRWSLVENKKNKNPLVPLTRVLKSQKFC
jgi:hypothetical protein